jgi:hypothetical protein
MKKPPTGRGRWHGELAVERVIFWIIELERHHEKTCVKP